MQGTNIDKCASVIFDWEEDLLGDPIQLIQKRDQV